MQCRCDFGTPRDQWCHQVCKTLKQSKRAGSLGILGIVFFPLQSVTKAMENIWKLVHQEARRLSSATGAQPRVDLDAQDLRWVVGSFSHGHGRFIGDHRFLFNGDNMGMMPGWLVGGFNSLLIWKSLRMMVPVHKHGLKLGWNMVFLKQKKMGFEWVWRGSASRRTRNSTTKPDAWQENENGWNAGLLNDLQGIASQQENSTHL